MGNKNTNIGNKLLSDILDAKKTIFKRFHAGRKIPGWKRV